MIPIIGNGHGGKIAGQYQTRGKCYTFPDGTTIHEGEFNRAVKARVLEQLDFKKIPYYDLVPEQNDISLKERMIRANAFHRKYDRNTFYLSIHANAGRGKGSYSFIAKQCSSKTKSLSNWSEVLWNKHFPETLHRGIRRKNFYVLRNSAMPALLFEFFFMDNEYECKKYLLTKEGRDRIAAYIVDVIENFIKYHS